MDIKYDKVADAVYFSVHRVRVAKTVEMDDRLNVDLDSAGNIVGIEILEASSQTQLVENLTNNVGSGIPIEIISGTPVIA
jgi:uncharacterized protein YuzE